MDIFYEKLKVAHIEIVSERPTLRYDPDWLARQGAFPISVSMPLTAERIEAEKILPWLANLLPESHLSEIGQQLGVSPQDILGILNSIGRDTAGALSISQPRPDRDEFRVVSTDDDLKRIIDELPHKPFLVGEEGVSMSLAGTQEKLPVNLVDGKVAIPINGTPSTHILKPDNKRLPGSVQNEAFCLTLAGLTGLDAAPATTGIAGDRSYLLVERYDRIRSDGRVRRIHQEDFCQLLGHFPSAKYEFNGPGTIRGPGLADLFAAAERHISPGARLSLLDAVVFNVLMCNVDAHSKNYSILIGAGGSVKLAPLYDVMCGEVYPKITKQLPQSIAGKTDATHLHGTDWQRLAKEVGLSPARSLRRVGELCRLVSENAARAKTTVEAMPAGGNQTLDQVERAVQKRCRRIANQLTVRDKRIAEDETDEIEQEDRANLPSP